MKSKKLRNLVYTAISAGLLCVLAPIALPLGVIPITFTTLLLYIYALVFSPKISIPSILIYICLGIIGLPVFSSFSSGIGHLFSATGGFVFGYIPMVAFIAVFKKRADTSVKRIIVLTLATLLLYFFGVFWFILAYTHTNNITNFIFILNFIPGDIIKIIVSVLIFPKIKSVVNK